METGGQPEVDMESVIKDVVTGIETSRQLEKEMVGQLKVEIEEVTEAMYLLQHRATMYLKLFGNRRVIMDFAFKSMMDAAQMKDSVSELFTCPDYLFDYIHRKSQFLSQPWRVVHICTFWCSRMYTGLQ
ncbi:Uncharacterized protein Adt_15024 [Abeliophyllum distichum]|uniref:Uncharacterized protein n=1 Tax=Abeliophyllum distichum TaxID=126358 RepID=A0ABD1U196_9LAMI